MFLFLFSVLSTLIQAAPFPQSLTITEFRSGGSRSLETINNKVIISPSYRKVRRQGRRGEKLPIKFPTLKVRDPNELNFPTNDKHQEDSGPVFGNSNSLLVEDVETKINDINASIESTSEAITTTIITSTTTSITSSIDTSTTKTTTSTTTTTVASTSTTTTTTTKTTTIATTTSTTTSSTTTTSTSTTSTTTTSTTTTKITTTSVKSTTTTITTTSTTITTSPPTTNFSTFTTTASNLEVVEAKQTEFIKEAVAETVENPKKHIVISIKTVNQLDHPNIENIKTMLENFSEIETSVFLNQEDSSSQNQIKRPGQLIFVDAQINSENKISGNVFSDGRPLEILEGVEYEEALRILNKVNEIINAAMNPNESTKVSFPKKIIIAIRTAVFVSEDQIERLKNTFDETGEETVVLVNEPEEVIRNEFSNHALSIFVSISVDGYNSVSGNVYYNSVPLEKLNSPQSAEASKILVTVKDILEEGLLLEEIPNIEAQDPVADMINPKKVVISLKTNLVLTEEESSQISSYITSRIYIPSILLVNTPTDKIQAELSGPALPILLDMNIDQEYQLRGNILYNYQPLENIQGEEFDEAVNILTTVKEALNKKINKEIAKQADILAKTTYTWLEETTTASDISEEVDQKVFITNEFDYTTPAPEQVYEDIKEEEASSESPSEPGPNIKKEWKIEYTEDVENLKLGEISDVLVFEITPDILEKNEIDFFISEEVKDITDGISLNDGSIEEGSGYFSSESDSLDGISDTPNVGVEVSNYGEKGVTELPGSSKSATPGVDFGLIQEITSH